MAQQDWQMSLATSLKLLTVEKKLEALERQLAALNEGHVNTRNAIKRLGIPAMKPHTHKGEETADGLKIAGLTALSDVNPTGITDGDLFMWDAATAMFVRSGVALHKIGNGYSLQTGGNDRGNKAVDLQMNRTADDKVASGNDSVISGGGGNVASAADATVSGGGSNTASNVNATISGGSLNTASGSNSTIGGGASNTASTDNSTVGGGALNVASGANSTVGGGALNTSAGSRSTISGGYEAKTSLDGQHSQASGKFATAGDAQTSVLTARKQTTDATPTELFLDGASLRLVLASDTTWAFRIFVVARRSDADNESAAYEFVGCIDNNAATVALVGSVTKVVVAEDTAGWDCDVTADNTNKALIITATGEGAKTIRWVARIELVEVTG